MNSKFPKFNSLLESIVDQDIADMATKIKRGAISYGKAGAHIDKKQKSKKPHRKQKHKNKERDSLYD